VIVDQSLVYNVISEHASWARKCHTSNNANGLFTCPRTSRRRGAAIDVLMLLLMLVLQLPRLLSQRHRSLRRRRQRRNESHVDWAAIRRQLTPVLTTQRADSRVQFTEFTCLRSHTHTHTFAHEGIQRPAFV
jgi:hypothetical protein